MEPSPRVTVMWKAGAKEPSKSTAFCVKKIIVTDPDVHGVSWEGDTGATRSGWLGTGLGRIYGIPFVPFECYTVRIFLFKK